MTGRLIFARRCIQLPGPVNPCRVKMPMDAYYYVLDIEAAWKLMTGHVNVTERKKIKD
jgi:hypothetical protein